MADETTQQPTAASQPVPRTVPIAVWSFVLGILSFNCGLLFTSIPAVICGHIALSKVRKSGGALRGKGIAIAGLILGYTAVPFGVLGTLFMIDMIKSDRERLHHLAMERKEIVSDDGKLKVTTSGFWVKRSDLNKRASLQAANKDKEMYVLVITEAKTNPDNLTLEKEHQLTRDRMLKTMKNTSATEPASLTVDGHPALQDEISGTENGTNVVFLHTTVDDGDHFQQILAWTLKSRWPKQNQLLREVTGSFRTDK